MPVKYAFMVTEQKKYMHSVAMEYLQVIWVRASETRVESLLQECDVRETKADSPVPAKRPAGQYESFTTVETPRVAPHHVLDFHR